LLTGHLYRE